MNRIHELTITDDCTTLYNARHLNYMLDTEIYRSQRYSFEFSLIFIDLDHFKSVNDTHGHLVGSKLLAEIGNLIKDGLRQSDMAFRYGGDEFVILLPQTAKENACLVARRLHRQIKEERTALSRARGKRLEGLPDAWCSRRSAPRQTKWQLPTWFVHNGNGRA